MKNPNQKNRLSAEQIVRWCLEHKDTFPFPDHHEDILLEDVNWGFDENDWCNCSKKYFAELKGVTAAQVTRWLQAGLPVRRDGRIEIRYGLAWHDEYQQEDRRRQRMPWVKQ